MLRLPRYSSLTAVRRGIEGFRQLTQAAVDTSVGPEGQELERFRESVQAFAASCVAQHAEEIDKQASFPTKVDLWRAMGDFGLHGELEWQLVWRWRQR